MEGARQRKAYKITKQREKWSDEEHARFVEAIEKYGRDWAKIVAHIGTRTVAQVRSHAQKFFLKLEKAGKADVVPPPRPKKRAAKPYPVQSEKSEELRKSKRFRNSSTATSTLSDTQEGTVGPSLTGTGSGRRSSFQTSLPSSRPMRAARLARAAMNKESSGDLEGDGSNVASAHESNNEESGGPSAIDNTSLLQSELDCNLAPSEGNKHSSASPDYNKLFTVVGNVFKSGDEANHQRMMQQLEPSQRETLAAMMNKLTGDLRNTQHSGQSGQEGGRVQARAGQPPMPTTPQPHAALACPSSPAARPGSQLDHAPSLALIPSSTSLAVPASLVDEALPTLQLLPGSQGTALLQPLPMPMPYSTPDLQGKPYSEEPESLQNSDSLQNSSTMTVADMQHLMPAPPPAKDPVDLLQDLDDAGQGSIAEQLLVSHPSPRSMEDELSLDVGPPGGPVVQVPMPKGSPGQLEESTPLDACLAQLTSETAPSLRIPGSDDFMDGWKISGNDPVWQSLDLKQEPGVIKPEDSSIFTF